jgi:hypothetical protein
MAPQKIPASIILAPRELKHYKRWQGIYTNTKPAEQGYIPTAIQYDDFQQWLKRQDSGYFSDIFDDICNHIPQSSSETITSACDAPVGSVCQHTMHPVAVPHLQSRCPVCTIDMHVNYMKVLSQALEHAGGHAPSCTLTSSDHQDIVYNAWAQGKLSTLKELSRLESLADEERAWSAQHPEAKLDHVRTASKALELYWSETTGYQEGPKHSKKKRPVVFAQETNFEPGRPEAYFNRKSPRYESGKYTVVREEGEEEEEEVVPGDSEDCHQSTVYHFGAAEGTKDQIPTCEEGQSTVVGSIDEPETDDGDSDWEDTDSDEEGSIFGYEDSEGDCSYFEYEDEETDFIVFG